MIGIIFFEKFGIKSEHWKLLDGLISFSMIASIIGTVPNMILVTYYNLFGPFSNMNIVIGLISVRLFGRLALTITFMEGFFVWYITEIVLRDQCEFDKVGMSQCIQFFTIVMSAGITFLLISIGQVQHNQFERFIGLPLDFSQKPLYDVR